MRAVAVLATVFLCSAAPASAATSPAGQALFKSKCGKCHALAAAGTTGKVGPALTHRHEPMGKVLTMMGMGGDSMPSFVTSLSSTQMHQIAAYVAAASK
jgi:mono/diheme cytochrome c family protein